MCRPPRRSPKLICGSNMTAFLSIQLVLLTLFMNRTSPDLPVRVVDLAKVLHPVMMPKALREDATLVTVLRDGRVFVGSDEATLDQLPSRIRSTMNDGGEQKVYINADARA